MNWENIKKFIRNSLVLPLLSLLIGLLISRYMISIDQSINFSVSLVIGLMIFLSVQLVFLTLNNKFWISKLVKANNSVPKVSLQLSVRQKNPQLIYNCLRSLLAQNYIFIGRIIVTVDGQGKDEQDIEQTFQSVFPLGRIVKLDKIFQDMDEAQKYQLEQTIRNQRYIYISQPRAGPKQAMYTGINLHPTDTDYICFVDEKMQLLNDTISQMVRVAEGYDQYLSKRPYQKPLGSIFGQVKRKQTPIKNLTLKLKQIASSLDLYFGRASIGCEHPYMCRKQVIDFNKQDWLYSRYMNICGLLLEKNMINIYNPSSKCIVQA